VREVVKAALHAIVTKDKIEKKFILAMIYDIANCPIFLKIIKEIPWMEGIGKLVSNSFYDEPVCISIILANLNKVI
jgi:hypothetical protein